MVKSEVQNCCLEHRRQGSTGNSGDDGHDAAVHRDRKDNNELEFLQLTRAMSTAKTSTMCQLVVRMRFHPMEADAGGVRGVDSDLEGDCDDVEIIQTSCRKFAAKRTLPLALRITMQVATA